MLAAIISSKSKLTNEFPFFIAFSGSSGGSGWNGGNSGWNNNGWESYGEHGSHSQPIAQTIAYKGHHPNASRR